MPLYEVTTWVAEDYLIEAETPEQAEARAIALLHERVDTLNDKNGYVEAIEFIGDNPEPFHYDAVEMKEEVS